MLYRNKHATQVPLKAHLLSPSRILHFAPAVVEEVAQIILGCGFGSLGLEFRFRACHTRGLRYTDDTARFASASFPGAV